MNKVISVNKPVGITSYDVIRNLKKKYPYEKIGHAGTLDPLASGVLICLIGADANKRQSEFMNVSKEYEFEILFGFKTDTYDVLGLAENTSVYNLEEVLQKVHNLLYTLKGEIKQSVPPFSAVKVKGKPLYRWYLSGKISEVEIPVKEVNIKKIEILNSRVINKKDLKGELLGLLGKVKKGFRQDKVKQSWEDVFKKSKQKQFLLVKIRASVSKGTYVRAIAHELGEKLGIGACTVSIVRTKVGEFDIDNAERLCL